MQYVEQGSLPCFCPVPSLCVCGQQGQSRKQAPAVVASQASITQQPERTPRARLSPAPLAPYAARTDDTLRRLAGKNSDFHGCMAECKREAMRRPGRGAHSGPTRHPPIAVHHEEFSSDSTTDTLSGVPACFPLPGPGIQWASTSHPSIACAPARRTHVWSPPRPGQTTGGVVVCLSAPPSPARFHVTHSTLPVRQPAADCRSGILLRPCPP